MDETICGLRTYHLFDLCISFCFLWSCCSPRLKLSFYLLLVGKLSEKGLSIYFSLALPKAVLRSPRFVPAACAGISITSLRHSPAVHEQYQDGNLDVIRIFGFNDSRRSSFRTGFACIYFALPSRYAELWFCCTLNENVT